MDLDKLKEIVSNGEDSRHQFKEDIRNSDALATEIVAFSNAYGGYIFIGVADTGKLTGLSREDIDRVNQLIINSSSQHVRSPVVVDTQNIALENGRVVIVIEVPEGVDKPYFDHQGVIWLKSGSDKRRVNSKEALKRLFQEVDALHADELPTKAGIEALDETVFAKFLVETYAEIFPSTDVERLKLLENMGLAVKDKLNLAALLLFAKKPQLYKP